MMRMWSSPSLPENQVPTSVLRAEGMDRVSANSTLTDKSTSSRDVSSLRANCCTHFAASSSACVSACCRSACGALLVPEYVRVKYPSVSAWTTQLRQSDSDAVTPEPAAVAASWARRGATRWPPWACWVCSASCSPGVGEPPDASRLGVRPQGTQTPPLGGPAAAARG